MPGAPRKQDREPTTLFEAHEHLSRQRPSLDAKPLAWAAFHRRSAEVYARVARVDLAHRHEAQSYASLETRRAGEIEDNPKHT